MSNKRVALLQTDLNSAYSFIAAPRHSCFAAQGAAAANPPVGVCENMPVSDAVDVRWWCFIKPLIFEEALISSYCSDSTLERRKRT
jgi:hypothetical protein